MVSLVAEIEKLSNEEILLILTGYFPGAVTFSSSFSLEDQVITHMIASNGLDISIFTLDTGRHFRETYATWERTVRHYPTKIKAYSPDHKDLEQYLEGNGPDAFYQSVESRQQCCHIRKVAPLKRALDANAVWITGLRAEHSPERQNLSALEWDDRNQIIKYNPLLLWTSEDVRKYIVDNNIPYNPLQDRGYESIGCEPCTRAVRPGEPMRAGRWWWEQTEKKECGLHAGY
jgi:phosphoadenosine phosphosulfate reductase